MKAAERAERLRELQRYGSERSAVRKLDLDHVNEIVHRVLSRTKRR